MLRFFTTSVLGYRRMRSCCGGIYCVADAGGRSGPFRCACRTERGRFWSSKCVGCSDWEVRMLLGPFHSPNFEFYVCTFRRTKGAGDGRPVRDWIRRRRRDRKNSRLVCLGRTCIWRLGLLFLISSQVIRYFPEQLLFLEPNTQTCPIRSYGKLSSLHIS